MRNYETPQIKVVKFETTDVILTSGLTQGGDVQVPGTGVIVPIPGTNLNILDNEY